MMTWFEWRTPRSPITPTKTLPGEHYVSEMNIGWWSCENEGWLGWWDYNGIMWMMGLMKRSLKVSLILLICRISRILRWLQGSAIGQSRQWTNPQVSFHHHHHLKLPIVIIIIRITIIFRRITIIKRIFTIISIFYKTFLNWRWIQHRHIDPFPEQCDHCKRDLTEEGCTAFGKVTIIRTIVKNIIYPICI